ncbi:MAG TPA: septum formation family protein [Acidimicrobiales bacterium]|nr:septum formation family protein [Acidimicrobiales bacterium]
MDPNDPSGGRPPGWVPPPGPTDPTTGWTPPGADPWPSQQGVWGPPGAAWGAPPAWSPEKKRKRFGWVAVIVAFLLGGFISAIVTVVGMVVLALAIGPPDAIAATHPGADEGVATVKVGDCLEDRPNIVTVAERTDVVECDEAHDAEVAGVIQAPGGDRKPGDDDLQAFVDDACRLAFRGYVGSNPDTSQYGYAGVVPTDDAWESGDRTVYCLVDTVNTPSGSGTVRGSGN